MFVCVFCVLRNKLQTGGFHVFFNTISLIPSFQKFLYRFLVYKMATLAISLTFVHQSV